MFTEEQNELVESAAEMLYGLIHVRYILTSKGMSAMVKLLSFILFFLLHSVDFVISCLQSYTWNFYFSWRNTKTMTLVDAQEFTAVDNLVFQLVSQIFLVQVLWKSTVQNVKIYIILDPSIKAVSFLFHHDFIFLFFWIITIFTGFEN